MPRKLEYVGREKVKFRFDNRPQTQMPYNTIWAPQDILVYHQLLFVLHVFIVRKSILCFSVKLYVVTLILS